MHTFWHSRVPFFRFGSWVRSLVIRPMTSVFYKSGLLSAHAKDTESKPATQTINPPLTEQDKRDIVCQRENPFYVNTAGNPRLLYPLVRMLKSGQYALLKSLATITIPEAPNMSQQEWQIFCFRFQLMVSDGPRVSVCESCKGMHRPSGKSGDTWERTSWPSYRFLVVVSLITCTCLFHPNIYIYMIIYILYSSCISPACCSLIDVFI